MSARSDYHLCRHTTATVHCTTAVGPTVYNPSPFLSPPLTSHTARPRVRCQPFIPHTVTASPLLSLLSPQHSSLGPSLSLSLPLSLFLCFCWASSPSPPLHLLAHDGVRWVGSSLRCGRMSAVESAGWTATRMSGLPFPLLHRPPLFLFSFLHSSPCSHARRQCLATLPQLLPRLLIPPPLLRLCQPPLLLRPMSSYRTLHSLRFLPLLLLRLCIRRAP